MKKYIFIVHHSEYADFLDQLRAIGVLHVQHHTDQPSAQLLESIALQKNIAEALKALRHRIVEKANLPALPANAKTGLEVLYAFQNLTNEQESLRQELNAVQKEISFVQPWGNFSLEDLQQLVEAGLQVHFFVCPLKQYQTAWEERYVLELIRRQPPEVYFVIVAPKDDPPVIDASEVPPPAKSLNDLRSQQQRLEARISAINKQLDRLVLVGQPALEAALAEVRRDIQLGMVVEGTPKEADGAIMLLSGFVPISKEATLSDFCQEKDILYLEGLPEPQDEPPILLQNSAFARLFEPISKLFALPNYRELDMTPFFAPFFLLFFGFCIGDAGYGLALVLGAMLYRRRASANFRPILSLVQVLGGATIVFGILTGTIFGVNLLEQDIAWLNQMKRFMLNSNQIFQLAIILGVVQILFGLMIKAYNQFRQFGALYAIAPIGWVVLLLTLLDLGALQAFTTVSRYAVWLGAGLILLFNNPKAGILSRLGTGVWELYGITGFFGDLLSYIRLFALGIASAILGFVVNDIALQIRDSSTYLGSILFVVFLIIGHGLNLLIALLGAFVHPMRLTFVEFYKNAGFKGGGQAYQPLSANHETN